MVAPRAMAVAALVAAFVAWAMPAAGQAPRRALGHMDLAVPGFVATVEPANPVVPKNIASGVRIVVRAGGQELSLGDVSRFVGAGFSVEAELSGPGLRDTITLPERGPGDPLPADPLLLPLPPLPTGGDYELRNVRLVAGGRAVLDVAARVPVKVIDQVLVTSVKTRPLTLEEIKQKGIVLDSDDYLGFEFTLGLKLESKPVTLEFPVVFDRNGVPVPRGTAPPPEPLRTGVDLPPMPTVVPMLLERIPEEGDPPDTPRTKITGPDGEPIRIPSVIVIPGNVGYLKQFFSAQLFVANGAPVGSGLVLHEVSGTVHLPAGADHELGTPDDPLALPQIQREGATIVQPSTMPVRGVGNDGAPGTPDDVEAFDAGEQGQAEFLIRGEKEGFHTLDFDVAAVLEGLPTGRVRIGGKARGAVLVRNPFFDVSFMVPSVVRKGERFGFVVTVTNIGQGVANDVAVSLDEAAVSGARLVSERSQRIATLKPGDAKTLTFVFDSQRTGQVVASYLHFDTQTQGGGDLKFTVGIGERGVPLSPDTLVLPASVDALPASVVDAAMRVLGQAWSVANAPSGTLPAGVLRTSRPTVTRKALALAEAGLRVTLGETEAAASRDLLFDFYGGADPGFDQLLRTTEAGHGLAVAVGAAVQDAVGASGGALEYEAALARLMASNGAFVSFIVDSGGGAPPAVSLYDGAERRLAAGRSETGVPAAEMIGGVVLPLGAPATAPVLGVVSPPTDGPYRLQIDGSGGVVDVAVTLPQGEGTFRRGVVRGVSVAAGTRARIVLDPSRGDALTLEVDADGDGVFETGTPLVVDLLPAEGPRLLGAAVVGPETLDGATPYGFQTALLFDRVVSADSTRQTGHYSVPDNSVLAAHPFLSGRLVLAFLSQPEGPYVPTTLSATGLTDGRGVAGEARTVPLESRLQTPGAVVSGRVFGADGTPVTSVVVTYSNNPRPDACDEYDFTRSGLAALPLDASGRYEFRYVLQDHCGWPWHILLKEPATGALRSVSGYVRAAGERIVLDIALFGRGGVKGTVRNLRGEPVPGARVTAVSVADPQIGGTTTTDGDGRYTIGDVTVGPVSVSAGLGPALGRSTGRIERAGTTSTVDVTLDGGTVKVSGTVRKLEGGVLLTVPGAQVVYSFVPMPGSPGSIPMAVTTSDADGRYAFEGMPVGYFSVSAALNARDAGSVGGLAAAGDDQTGRDVIIAILPDQTGYGTARGLVRFANLTPAPDVLVRAGDRAVLTDANGLFELRGLPIRPYQPQVISAETRDGLRSATGEVLLNAPGDVVEGLVLTLSGVGAAEFTVLDTAGAPVRGQQVLLDGNCANPCGCVARSTDAAGRVRFDRLPLGTVSAQAIREQGSFVDVAAGTASIRRDGETGFGVLRFSGGGSITGLVLDPDGRPAFGADLSLVSRHYVNDGVEQCGLVNGVSHRVRTDTTGRFRFSGVNLGPVSLAASQAFFPTQVGAAGALVQNGQTLDFTLRLVSTISGELSGTVMLPDGVTPAGAGVEVTAAGVLPDVVVSTNEEGRFHFAKIFPEGGYRLTARDPVTGSQAESNVYLRTGESLEHDLRLLGRGTVRVRVVDGAGQPVTNAFVRLSESSFPRRTYEAAAEPASQGVAEFEGVFEGPLSVEASDSFARGGRASGVLPRGGGDLDLEVALTVTGTVAGHFRMPDRTTPVPFGIVHLFAGGRGIGQTIAAGSGDVGSFRFDYVPAGPVRIEAQDPATARTGIAVGTLETEGQALELDVFAEGLGTVSGLVTSNGQPRPGASVELSAGAFRAVTLADGTGRYVVRGAPEGRVVVTASLSNGFLSGTAAGTLAGDGDELTLDVALRDSGRLEGQVFAADGTQPAPPSVVSMSVGGTGGGAQSTTTDPEGRFSFERVPSGHAQLAVDVLGSIDRARGEAEVPPAGTATVSLRLNGVGGLVGKALDFGGAAVAGDVAIDGNGPFPYSFHLKLGPSGTFHLPAVLAGPFTASLTARTGEFTLYGSASSVVPPGGVGDVTVRLQPSGTVTGLVLRADGATPALGTEVTLVRANGSAVSLQAQGDGRFTARGVPLGAFSVSASDPLSGGVARVLDRSVETDGEVVDLGTIVLDDGPVSVLTVDPADGSPAVAVDRPVVLTLSDALASASGIEVRDGEARVGGGVSLSADRLRVTLHGPWPDGRDLEVVFSTAVTDVFGRHPSQPFSSRFHTVDLSAPSVVSMEPPSQAIQVTPASPVVAHFNEALRPDVAGVVALSSPAGPVTGTATLTDPTTVTFTPSAPLSADARYTVTVTGASDLAGNTQTVPFVATFATLDTRPPSVILTPADGARLATSTPTLTASISDALSGPDLSTATLTLDGAPVAASRGAATLTFTPASLADGLHAVEASAADRAGNRSTSVATFQTDVTPPSPAVIGGPTNGQVLTGTVPVSATATDATSGVGRVELLEQGAVILTLPGPALSGALNTVGLSEGPHTFAAWAVDGVGNVGPLGPPVTVVVDNRPLTLVLTAPPAGTRVRDAVTVAAVVSEPVERVEFAGGGATLTVSVAPYQATLDLGGLAEGPATVTATAFGIGGGSTSASLPIVIDRTPPPPPDASRIVVDPVDGGSVVVRGQAGAVEGQATVEATAAGLVRSAAAAGDGSFAVRLPGVTSGLIALVAIDTAGNRSLPTEVTVDTSRTPDGVPVTGMRMWMRADTGVVKDAAGLVSRWEDQSESHNDLLQGTPSQQPAWRENVAGGLPALHFDGATDVLAFTNRLTTVRTVFWVVREDPAAPAVRRVLLGDCCDYHLITDDGPNIWNRSFTSQAALGGQTFLNGTPVDGRFTARPRQMAVLSLVTTGPVNAGNFGHDRGDNTWWFGDLAELIVYDRPLSGPDRKAVEDYLAVKYALYVPSVGTPTFSPNGGTFTGSTTVTLASSTPQAEIRYTTDGRDPTESSALYTDPLLVTATTRFKARAYRTGRPPSGVAAVTFVSRDDFTPLSVAGAQLWLRADAGAVTDSAGRVSTWVDQSGRGNDLSQSYPPSQAVLVPDAAGGLPALRFDGRDDVLDFASRLTTVRTVFWVVREDPAAAAIRRVLLGDCCEFNLITDDGPNIWNRTFTSPFVLNGQTFMNGLPVDGRFTARPRQMSVLSLVTTGPVKAGNFGHDRGDNTWWYGDLAELVVYDRALSSLERQSVEAYLARKYGTFTPQAGDPVVSPAGGVLSAATPVQLTSTSGTEIHYTTDGSDPTLDSPLYSGPLAFSATTTLKARAFGEGLTASRTTTVTFLAPEEATPAALAGLKLWVRADAGVATDAAGRVSAWTDQSAAANHLAQGYPFSEPTLMADAAGGLPALHFDGLDDVLGFANRLTTIRTVFWVLREDPAAAPIRRVLLGDCCEYNLITDDGPNIWNRSFTSSAILSGQTYLNGVLVDGRSTRRPTQMAVLSVVTTGPVNAGNFGQDRGDNTWWFGDLAELIVYDVPLSDVDRKAVEAYLARRWDIPASPAMAPVISPAGGPFTPPLAVTLASALSDSIRYTLDGTEPTPASPLYADPITIQRSTVLKAKAFGRGLSPSGTSTAAFIDSLAAPETTVTGRIVDRDGTARAGAHVACGAVSGETDLSGRFELSHVSTAAGTLACALSATLADGTVVSDTSARFTALPGAETDLGTIGLFEPTYMGYNPANSATLTVVGFSATTAYRLTSLDDHRLVASGTLDRYQTVALSLSQVRHFELVTTSPVLATFGFDCCNVGGSFFYPATDGRKLIGRDFIVRIPVLSGNNDFVVFAHEAATVTIRNAISGAVVLSQALAAGQLYSTTGPPLSAGVVYRVEATGDVSLMSDAINAVTAVPALGGADVGTDFRFGIRPFDTGGLAVFAYEDATAVVTTQTGAVVLTRTVPAGQVAYANGLSDGKYHLTSTGRVGLFAGSTQGGTALRDLGDDVTVTLGDHGRDILLHSLSQGAFVFALESDTHVSINGTSYVLQAGQFRDLPPDGLWRITSDKPVVAEAIGGNGLDDWHAALRLVDR